MNHLEIRTFLIISLQQFSFWDFFLLFLVVFLALGSGSGFKALVPYIYNIYRMSTWQDSNWVNVPGWRSGPELRDPGTAIHLLWFQGGRQLIPSIIIYIIIKGQYSWDRRNTKYNFIQLNQWDRKLIISVNTKYKFHKPDQGDSKLILSIQNTISTIQTRGIGSSSCLYKIQFQQSRPGG